MDASEIEQGFDENNIQTRPLMFTFHSTEPKAILGQFRQINGEYGNYSVSLVRYENGKGSYVLTKEANGKSVIQQS
jgi:hypothetical protein